MAGSTNIEWTDRSWNPIVGCSIVSPGCTNCYAMKMAARLDAIGANANYAQEGIAIYRDTTKKVNGNAVWTGKVAMAPDRTLTAPVRWKRGRKIFVNSMGDLFHESIPDEWIDRVFAVMALCPQHTFQVLTKRAERMMAYLKARKWSRWFDAAVEIKGEEAWPYGGCVDDDGSCGCGCGLTECRWIEAGVLPNVWLGVSAERQQEADERIPLLLQTPAAVRFISAEPLIGPIDLTRLHHFGDQKLNAFDGNAHVQQGTIHLGWSKLDWVIVGGESGPCARMMDPEWARQIKFDCERGGAAFFMKQMTGKKPIPTDLLVRQFPAAIAA